MSRRRPLREYAARRRAEERAKRRQEPGRLKRVSVLAVAVFAGGMLIGTAVGVLVGRGGFLPPELRGQVDRIVAGLSGETGAVTENADPAETAAPRVRAVAPGPGEDAVAADPSTDAAVPQVLAAEVEQPAVSSEALDAATAISLEPLPYPLLPEEPAIVPEILADAGVAANPTAGAQAPMSPPLARTHEAPANNVRVIYDEARASEPAAPVNLAALVERAKAIPGAEPSRIPRLTETERAVPGQGRPVWQANAVPAVDTAGRPMIAVVFDDLGLNRPNTRRVIALPGPLTLSFMTYAEDLEAMTGKAREAGHELMVHMPMEPMDGSLDPGPEVLLTQLDQDEIRRRLEWGLGRFTGYVGINNHMGSRFTAQTAGMAVVFAELKRRSLLFLDSKTAVNSAGAGLAGRFGVPFIERDIFIDNNPEDPASIRRQLDRLETLARRRGAAVGIGHPHSATIEVLSPWLGELAQRGFALVPISALVRRRIRLAEEGDSAG